MTIIRPWLIVLCLFAGSARAATYNIPVPNVFNSVGAWVSVSTSAENRIFVLEGAANDVVIIEFETPNGSVQVARMNGPSAKNTYTFTCNRVRAVRLRGNTPVTLKMSAESAAVLTTSGDVSSVYQQIGPVIPVSSIRREMTVAYNGCPTCSILVEGSIGGVWGTIGRLNGHSYFHGKGGYDSLRTRRLAGAYDAAEKLGVFGLASAMSAVDSFGVSSIPISAPFVNIQKDIIDGEHQLRLSPATLPPGVEWYDASFIGFRTATDGIDPAVADTRMSFQYLAPSGLWAADLIVQDGQSALALDAPLWVAYVKVDVDGNMRLYSNNPVASVVAENPIKIGSNGVAISASIRGTLNVDLTSIAAGTCAADQNITVAGAAAGAECVVGGHSNFTGALMAQCFVSAPDTVKLRVCNNSAGAVDPPAQTHSVRVFNP
jgi:hypothetical protein